MKLKEFIEREYFVNKNGLIFDNSLNENLEDNHLEVSKIKLKLIYKKQSKEVNEVLDENEKENIMIYKIFDMGDKNYNEWYGTQDDIIKYLKEQNNLKDDESWIENLEDYGLTFEMIYEVEK